MPASAAQLQPPVKGLNFRKPAINLDPQEALLLDNILPKASSGELRAGYVVYTTGIPGAVVTLAPFIGNATDDKRVFAFNDQGDIYDVTHPGEHIVSLARTTQRDGNWDYTNSQGPVENYLILVSPEGGYWTYSKSDGLKQREITGDAKGKRFSAVFNWKDRVWLIEENSTKAYYLGTGAIQGEAQMFDFGPVMNQGGWLSYGSNWTFNAGYDIDDYLVLVTSSGEVIVYKGYDPSDINTFNLQGVWYIGKTPVGNKCFTQFGGEMFVMSSLGVVPISKLVNGQVANEYSVSSANVAPKLHAVFTEYCNDFGWEMDMIYNQSFLMLKTPIQRSGKHSYWVMNVQTGAWGTISGMPMNCATQVDEKVYFGTANGEVCVAFVGDTDASTILGDAGRPIIGRYMGGFSDYGDPTHLKIWQLARPVFMSKDTPSVGVRMLTEYDQAMPSIDMLGGGGSGGRFDDDNWNQCVWAGGANTFTAWSGLNGMGYYGAIGMSVTGPAATQYISTNVTLTVGGAM